MNLRHTEYDSAIGMRFDRSLFNGHLPYQEHREIIYSGTKFRTGVTQYQEIETEKLPLSKGISLARLAAFLGSSLWLGIRALHTHVSNICQLFRPHIYRIIYQVFFLGITGGRLGRRLSGLSSGRYLT